MAKIIHEKNICIGCGICVSSCPKYWEMSGDGKANLKNSVFNQETSKNELEVDEVDCNSDAAEACPVQCIVVIEK